MSKAFTKDDRPDGPLVVRHRAALPDGVPNYVTPHWVRALRGQLAATAAETTEAAARRAELERQIASAVVAPAPADRREIRFGARVTLRGSERQLRRIQIVGIDEAEPASGLIAFVAPLARALLGQRTGDAVSVRSPGGTEELEVVAVDYDET